MKTKLELLLDCVKPREREITLDVSEFTKDQCNRVIASAELRGFNVTGDGRHLLIRDLR